MPCRKGRVVWNSNICISGHCTGGLDVYLQFQYVNALAENLINYKERTEAFRLGFSIVR